jgi:hypothetical protein
MALDQLQYINDDLFSLNALLSNACRRSERAFWAPRARPFGQGRLDRRRLRDTNTAAMLTVQKRSSTAHQIIEEPSETAKKLAKRNMPPKGWWQVVYNLACYYAIEPDTPRTPRELITALELLERSLECEGSWQLDEGWLKTDPDLEALHELPRFERFCTTVPTSRKEN